jgi:hypothetical protein
MISTIREGEFMRLLALVPVSVALSCAAVASAKPVHNYPCAWVSGRLSFGAGTPSIRIRPNGSHRLFGVVSREHPKPDDAYSPEIPPNVQRLLAQGNGHRMKGQFLVCPVSPERKGHMRFVVVKAARNLVPGA